MARRTLLYLCVAFILGVALGQIPWALMAVPLGCLVFLLASRRTHDLPILALCVLLLAAGYFRAGLAGPDIARLGNGPWRGRAVTAVEMSSGGLYKGMVRVEPGNAVVMLYGRSKWAQHDGILFAGSIAEPLQARNPGEFDYQSLLERQGIAAVVFVDSLEVVARYRPGLLSRVRGFLSQSLMVLGESQRPLARALVLGDRSQLGAEMRENWRKAGASHLLAVSGLHVSIVGGAAFFLVRRRFGMRGSLFVSTLLVFLYAAVIGNSVSAWRAALTFALVSLASIALRRQHWPTTIALVAATLLAISPLSLGDPGFQLSFAAAAGIMHMSPLLSRLVPTRWPRSLSLLCSASLAAQIATLPVLLAHFAAVPLYGLASSLLLIPLAPVLLVLALATALLGSTPLLGHATGGLFALASLPFDLVTSGIAGLPLSTINLVKAPWPLLVFYYALLLVLPRPRFGRMQRLAMLILAVLMVSLTPGLMMLGEHSVTFLSVGNADAIHIKAGASHMLVDTAEALAMQRAVLPYLASQGINRLQTVYITHSHSDHSGGLADLLRNMKVDRIVSGPEVQVVRQAAGEVPLIAARMGMVVQGRGYSVTVIMAENDALTLNSRSAALVVTCGTLKVLLAADLEREAEALLRESFPRVDVLKVAHHGSATSTTPLLLDKVSPTLAVISVGANRYGHPAASVLERLRVQGVVALRTDESGAVRIVAKRNTLLVYEFQSGRFELLGRYALQKREVSGFVFNWQLPGALATCQAA